AQTPLAERSGSRLLVLDQDAGGDGASAPVMPHGASGSGLSQGASYPRPGTLRDCTMRDFPSLLRAGDLLVFNDTKVVAARLVGTKPSGGRVEIFLERVVGTGEAVV